MQKSLIRWFAAAAATLALVSSASVAVPPAKADDGSVATTRFVVKGDPYKRVQQVFTMLPQ